MLKCVIENYGSKDYRNSTIADHCFHTGGFVVSHHFGPSSFFWTAGKGERELWKSDWQLRDWPLQGALKNCKETPQTMFRAREHKIIQLSEDVSAFPKQRWSLSFWWWILKTIFVMLFYLWSLYLWYKKKKKKTSVCLSCTFFHTWSRYIELFSHVF